MSLFVAFLAFCVIVREVLCAIKIHQNQKTFCLNHQIDAFYLPSPLFFIIKRLCDICISLAVCLCILPILYIVLAPIIKLGSKGPVIYKQKRIGQFGKLFTCYKFRSMYLNDDETVAGPNDSRVTKIGRLIRKTHIDEFPQFFNVLISDMSLVGPRPYTPYAASLISSSRYSERLLVKPGITGLAQINSNRTLEHSRSMFFDLTYLENMSFLKDILLVFETLKFKDVSY
ncbi:MAG: sugar transferase [Alphaproteobacteria bacterium]|nr:sugar transferase [Alphaproteobacteria bacterium]